MFVKDYGSMDLNCFGFEPEHVQCLIHTAITENRPDNFVGLRHAALYSVMFWGTACFEEVKDFDLCQISKRQLFMNYIFSREKPTKLGNSKSV